MDACRMTKPLMTILGVEFSAPQRSVALRRDALLAEAAEAGGRHTAALGMIERVLAEANAARGEVDTLAVGLGPGSYTGIRAAIALAQGWQLANGVKLLGVSSVEAIVAQAHAESPAGRVAVVIDAQRQEFYLAAYELNAAGWTEVEPLKIVSLAAVRGRTDGAERLVGPEVTRWFPAGQIISPTAATLTRLAAGRTDFVSGDKLEPVYLRDTAFVKAPPSRVVPTPG
jgi:tRNA threonylcarbamoyl adenosine modification protein YeaZ